MENDYEDGKPFKVPLSAMPRGVRLAMETQRPAPRKRKRRWWHR